MNLTECKAYSTEVQPRLQYPLMLFADFPSLPSSDVLLGLVAVFHQRVVPSTPFMPSLALPEAGAPLYLVLPMALLGAGASPNKEHNLLADTLWYASNNLLTGVLEIDNSIASRMDLIQATCSGYVDTSMDRLMRKEIRAWAERPGTSDDSNTTSSLICFYFLVDTLRAIHLQTLPALVPSQTSFPLSTGHSFQDLYTTLVVDYASLPAGLTSDGYLVLLLALVSDVVSLAHMAGAYLPHDIAYQGACSIEGPLFDKLDPTVGEPGITDAGTQHSRPGAAYDNPFLPSTATSEYLVVSGRLHRALDAFCRSIGLASGTAASTTASPAAVPMPDHLSYVPTSSLDPTIVPLVQFCRMALEAGPTAHLLPALAGYTPQDPATDVPSPAASLVDWHTLGLRFTNATVSGAWQVLETVDGSHRYGHPAEEPRLITPIWYPILVFQAALVLWGQTMEAKDSLYVAGGVVLAKKKVLGAFQLELEQMTPAWGCTKRMINTIKALK
ncbi:hypothetical protein SEUCBS140593_004925 [Sporothrix eucalyptigena]|uniref:C6 zinc finger domain containing protein n=1 Tax=Sporothrix eucalyptigena TaxID=1812306 RepID=A0ABP0BTX6_9PEZI